MHEYVTSGAAASIIGVSHMTMRRWVKDGRIPTIPVSTNGVGVRDMRIMRREDAEALRDEYAAARA